MIIRRIGTLIARRISQFPLPNRTSLYSSAASNRRISNHFEGDEEGGSAAYRLALKFQRPKTVQVERGSRNRVSLIGTVDVPLTVMNTKSDKFGVRTRLIIKKPYDSDRRFKIGLRMWNDMGRICMEHVKPGDFFYPGEAGMERYNSPLYLWQVFFTSLSEWWDNRKKNPSQPDFKHKDTGEALWLNPDDPPWIRKQLELLDSRLAQGAGDQVSCRNCISEWVYDE
ncbi:Nbs-lrr resistance protein isoform 1 [Hibiscus syriacus]|uniref:Nbs-lrr resistance protein isoform 1 n=1 Tax=Hibiscus syriacus TaxID=106335 RepID=A0A6A2WMM9_HIBSY|nr:Nbs-lrr resistance protein isoform 1 [Hibiscus syriacus]